MESCIKKNEISVSVVVPVYNTEEYLRECIDSVIHQTLSDWELILVDDGSSDSSGRICEEYSQIDGRITVVHKNNGGQSSARNVGMKKAAGKYIYFLDSDDYIVENTLEKLVQMAESENADTVFFEYDPFIDCREENMSSDILKRFDCKRKYFYETANGLEQLCSLEKNGEYFVSVPLHLYRKKYLDDNNIRFTEGIIHEDELFSSEIYIHNGITAHCHEPMYMRRMRSGSTMTSNGEEVSAFRYRSYATIYYAEYNLIKKLRGNNEARKIIARRTIWGIWSFYSQLSEKYKKEYKRINRRINRHALIHYGIYDGDIAYNCSPVSKYFIKIIRYLRRHLITG